MDNIIEIRNGSIIMSYSLIKNYSKKIRIVLDQKIIYEDVIEKDLFLDQSMYAKGSIIKLYLNVDNIWIFAERYIISLNNNKKDFYNILISKSQLDEIIEAFQNDVSEVISYANQ